MLFGLFRLFGYASDPTLTAEQVHAIVGEPARFTRTPPPGRPLTVVTWNIAQGTRYERIRDGLETIDADIYLLQEVDMGVRRSDYRLVARELAHDLGLNWVFGGEFQEIGQSRRDLPAITGQAILSRYPIHDASALPFENQARLRWRLDPFQPRRGGRMALRAESGGVVVYNAHIESAKNDGFRHKQVHEMLFDHLRSEHAERPVVFAGDFNTEMLPAESPVVRCLVDEGFVDALGTASATRRTSVNHVQPLDWIFIRNMFPRRGRVVDVPKASDHFPLEAAVALTAAGLAAE
jgi:endonuclease/exonuclease/phosphatase family metal-dependent hydrolase